MPTTSCLRMTMAPCTTDTTAAWRSLALVAAVWLAVEFSDARALGSGVAARTPTVIAVDGQPSTWSAEPAATQTPLNHVPQVVAVIDNLADAEPALATGFAAPAGYETLPQVPAEILKTMGTSPLRGTLFDSAVAPADGQAPQLLPSVAADALPLANDLAGAEPSVLPASALEPAEPAATPFSGQVIEPTSGNGSADPIAEFRAAAEALEAVANRLERQSAYGWADDIRDLARELRKQARGLAAH